MTLDPTSQLFKDCIAITGWPDWVSGLSVERLDLDTGFTEPSWSVVRDHYGYGISGHIAQALLEHHFRVWLEGKNCSVSYQPSGHNYMAMIWVKPPDGKWGFSADTLTSLTYIDCQMKAILVIQQMAKAAEVKK